MKKSLLSLFIALSAIIGGSVSAELEISSLFYDGLPLVDDAYTQLLNNYDNTWGYLDTAVSCNVNDGVSIEVPLAEDFLKDDAASYDVFFSPYRVSQLKSGDTSIDTSKISIKRFEIKENEQNVKFEIPSNELSPDTIYYGFIVPIDTWDEVGTPTKEICFKLSNNACLQDVACDSFDRLSAPSDNKVENEQNNQNTGNQNTATINTHGAASDCVGMDMANVTHTINGDTITLKWTAVDGDTVEIGIFDPEEEVYKSLGTAKMRDEKFNYKMKWDGEQNFELTNGCKSVFYKADAKRGVEKQEPEIKVTPATGPAENALYVAIAAVILYGAYAVFFKKSENN